MIKVLHPGIYSCIQDQGRFGYAKLGVPVSGAMDDYSYQIGNILLKNRSTSASIEVTMGGAKFLFEKDTFICITGADFSPRLNNQLLEMKTVYEIKKGSILSFGKRVYGARAYIAVQGGIQSISVLKSKSFYKGITPNERLKKGDELPYLDQKPYGNRGFSKMKILNLLFDSEMLDCYPGPEFHLLKEKEQEKLAQDFTISNENNRVGYRLVEALENNIEPILTSSVLPGTVQLTPSGKLIILMKDCQVTGGYPRILQLGDFAISQLSQKMSGQKIRFQINL